MKNRKWKILTSGLVAVTVLIIIVASRQQAQDKSDLKDEATPIQKGVMTEQQKKHSRLYNRSESKNLTFENEDIRIVIFSPFVAEESLKKSRLSKEEYTQKEICQADAIVIGKVKNKISQLSEDATSIFTDYAFEIKSVLNNKSPLNIQDNEEITLTRSGGAVKLNNRLIEVINKTYPLLKINKEYLLFLDYLSESNSFKPSSYQGTFEIQTNIIKQLGASGIALNRNNIERLDDFNYYIREVISQCSNEKERSE